MIGGRLVAAVLGALLSGPALSPASAPPAPPAAPPPAAPAGSATPTSPATPAPFRPCPVAVGRPATVPAAPARPVRDGALPELGGTGLATAGLTLPPGAPPLPAGLSASSWLVADLDTGAVLAGCGPHEPHPPASVQKLLLAETLLPRLDPAGTVTVVPEDQAEPGSSAVGLLPGGRYPVETLWLGLLLESGNDAANALARVGGGSLGVPGTIAAMNAEALRLGALDTHAVTPSGLDGPGQFTTAYDLALIARADFARDDFRRYDTTPRAQIPAQPPKDPRGFQIQNENELLTRYPGALGGKTGFTDLARHTYVGAAQRGDRRLVVTLLSAEAQPVRVWQQGAALLDWAFGLPGTASVGHLVTPEEADRLLHPPSPTPAGPPAVAVAGVSVPARGHGWLGLALGAVALVAFPLVMTLYLRRRLRLRRGRQSGRFGRA